MEIFIATFIISFINLLNSNNNTDKILSGTVLGLTFSVLMSYLQENPSVSIFQTIGKKILYLSA